MKTLDQRILELLKKYMEKLKHKKVLTSREEIEANTNETNLVAAPVVAELYNKLMNLILIKTVSKQVTVTAGADQGIIFTWDIPVGYKPVLIIPGNAYKTWIFWQHGSAVLNENATQASLYVHNIHNTNLTHTFTANVLFIKAA